VNDPGLLGTSTKPPPSSIASIADHRAAQVDDGRLALGPHHQIHVAGIEGDLDETVRLAFTDRRVASEVLSLRHLDGTSRVTLKYPGISDQLNTTVSPQMPDSTRRRTADFSFRAATSPPPPEGARPA
jgi:hypothetical protein